MERAIGKKEYRKVVTVLLAIVTLLSGGMVYLLFRPDYLLMFDWLRFIHLMGFLECIRSTSHWLPEWIEYALPDGLWIFSYTLIIGCIWNFDIKKAWIAILVLPLIAIIDESLQYFQLVAGTFDVLDIIAYASASLLGCAYLRFVKTVTI